MSIFFRSCPSNSHELSRSSPFRSHCGLRGTADPVAEGPAKIWESTGTVDGKTVFFCGSPTRLNVEIDGLDRAWPLFAQADAKPGMAAVQAAVEMDPPHPKVIASPHRAAEDGT